jgi:hypothetical protein
MIIKIQLERKRVIVLTVFVEDYQGTRSVAFGYFSPKRLGIGFGAEASLQLAASIADDPTIPDREYADQFAS